MTLDHPWMLLLLVLPAFWVMFIWHRRNHRDRRVASTGIVTAVLILALSQPKLILHEWRMAVTVLADTSSSILGSDLRRESEFINSLEKARGKHAIRVIPFTRGTHGVGIESAVRQGLATLPADRVSRLVILSDGADHLGSADHAARQAKQLGIPIDTLPLDGSRRPGLRVDMEAAPLSVFRGEQFSIEVTISSPQRTVAEIQVLVEGKPIASHRVSLVQGANPLRLDSHVDSIGTVELAVVAKAPEMAELRIAQRLTIHRPRALLVSSHPLDADSSLTEALARGRFEVTRAASVPARLDGHEMMILDRSVLQSITAARKSALEEFVRRGNGLAVIRNEPAYIDASGPEEVLERLLPASLEAAKRDCVVLVLERAAVMDGQKLELAKLEALGLVENLRRADMAGVLTFDDTFKWLEPIQSARERDRIDLAIKGVTAGGGLNIAAALEEAVRRIQAVDASSRHIILLMDGTSRDPAALALARKAAAQHITVSAVSVGGDLNRPYLARLVSYSRGTSLVLHNPSELDHAVIQDGDTGPARWKYGQGHIEILPHTGAPRSANRFAAGNRPQGIFTYLLSHARKSTTRVRYDDSRDELVIDYQIDSREQEPAAIPVLIAFGPRDFQQPVRLERVAGGLLRGRFRTDHLPGMFRVRPAIESAIPEVRVFVPEGGLDRPNEASLRWISSFTGGRFNPDPADIFKPDGRAVTVSVPLWPALAVFILGVILFEAGDDSREVRRIA